MSADMKCKIEDKPCDFNEEWTAKYYFMEVGKEVVCLLCHELVAIFND